MVEVTRLYAGMGEAVIREVAHGILHEHGGSDGIPLGVIKAEAAVLEVSVARLAEEIVSVAGTWV